jgi:integrase
MSRATRCRRSSINGQNALVVGHLRWHLSGIFKMALGDGVVDLHPTTGLYTPACKSPAEKRVMSREDIVLALKTLDLHERLIFRMAVFDGMRPGEILAIRVGNISDHSILINQRLYKGNLDSPKGKKGKRTSRVVALSPGNQRWTSRNGAAAWANDRRMRFCFRRTIFGLLCVGTISGTGACGRN